jgi:uncharacterized protein YbaP (TraB family)
MLKKILALSGFAFVLSFFATAQVEVSPAAKVVVDSLPAARAATVSPYAPTKDENALLWIISGKNLKDTSYLYGTIHMIEKKDFLMTDHTKTAFGKSDQVAFEIDMDQMGDFTVLFSLLGQVLMKDGMTLDKLLSAADYQLVKTHFEEMGLPMFMFRKVKPMFLSTMASGDMTGGGGMGEESDIVSYEMEFMQMAKDQKKPVSGLETIEYQMSVFDSIPYKDQAEMLVESVKAEKGGSDEFAEMVKLYTNQDIVGMQSMFKDDTEGLGRFEDVFLKNRNLNWIPIIEKMMMQKPTFFAVGAGHLGGSIGVIALLREAGYVLTPVKPTTVNR